MPERERQGPKMEQEAIRCQRHCGQVKDKPGIRTIRRWLGVRALGNHPVGIRPRPGAREPLAKQEEPEAGAEQMRRRVGELTESARQWTHRPA